MGPFAPRPFAPAFADVWYISPWPQAVQHRPFPPDATGMLKREHTHFPKVQSLALSLPTLIPVWSRESTTAAGVIHTYIAPFTAVSQAQPAYNAKAQYYQRFGRSMIVAVDTADDRC